VTAIKASFFEILPSGAEDGIILKEVPADKDLPIVVIPGNEAAVRRTDHAESQDRAAVVHFTLDACTHDSLIVGTPLLLNDFVSVPNVLEGAPDDFAWIGDEHQVGVILMPAVAPEQAERHSGGGHYLSVSIV